MDWFSPFRVLIGVAAGAVSVGLVQQPSAAMREAAPVAQMARADRAAPSGHRLERADDGLFYLTGRVDGVSIRFVVDTGANVTVLSPVDARRIAWRADQLAGETTLATAGGRAAMRWARIDTIAIAGHRIEQIDAALPDRGTSPSLLGQDVLSQFGSVTQRGDHLFID